MIHPLCVLSLLITLIVLELSATTSNCLAQEPDQNAVAREFQQKSLEYRKSNFHHGEVTISIQDLKTGEDGTKKLGEPVKRKVWFDGDKLRNEGYSEPETTKFRGIVANGIYIDANNDDLSAVIAPVKEYEDTNGAIKNLGLIHPRWIGMSFNRPDAISPDGGFLVLQPDAGGKPESSANITKETINGIETTKIEYKYAGTTTGRMNPNSAPTTHPYEMTRCYWIAPEQGYALLRVRYETLYPEAMLEIVNLLDSSYELIDGKNWCVKESDSSTVRNGETIWRTRFVLEDVTFEKPSGNVFTIEALKMRDGRNIKDRTKGPFQQDFFWDGTKPVKIPTPLGTPQ